LDAIPTSEVRGKTVRVQKAVSQKLGELKKYAIATGA
jgi:hypothetical protein